MLLLNCNYPVNRCYTSLMTVFILLCFLVFAAQVKAGNDLVFEAYNDSRMESKAELEGKEHRVLLSTPQRINNEVRIERDLRLSGVAKQYLFRVDSGYSAEQAYQYYVDYLKKSGEILYRCRERACGSSNYWAIDVFSETMLYGRDSDQFYLAGQIRLDDKMHTLAIYAVMNGRKQHYVSVIAVESDLPKQALSFGASSLGLYQHPLQKQQVLTLDKAKLLTGFDAKSAQSNELWLVAYGAYSDKPVQIGIVELDKSLRVLKQHLQATLGPKFVIQTYNSGPFYQRPSSVDFVSNEEAIWFQLFAR